MNMDVLKVVQLRLQNVYTKNVLQKVCIRYYYLENSTILKENTNLLKIL